jgi:hypothetical protein
VFVFQLFCSADIEELRERILCLVSIFLYRVVLIMNKSILWCQDSVVGYIKEDTLCCVSVNFLYEANDFILACEIMVYCLLGFQHI